MLWKISNRNKLADSSEEKRRSTQELLVEKADQRGRCVVALPSRWQHGIDLLIEFTLAQYAAFLDAKKILFDMHNDRAYRDPFSCICVFVFFFSSLLFCCGSRFIHLKAGFFRDRNVKKAFL